MFCLFDERGGEGEEKAWKAAGSMMRLEDEEVFELIASNMIRPRHLRYLYRRSIGFYFHSGPQCSHRLRGVEADKRNVQTNLSKIRPSPLVFVHECLGSGMWLKWLLSRSSRLLFDVLRFGCLLLSRMGGRTTRNEQRNLPIHLSWGFDGVLGAVYDSNDLNHEFLFVVGRIFEWKFYFETNFCPSRSLPFQIPSLCPTTIQRTPSTSSLSIIPHSKVNKLRSIAPASQSVMCLARGATWKDFDERLRKETRGPSQPFTPRELISRDFFDVAAGLAHILPLLRLLLCNDRGGTECVGELLINSMFCLFPSLCFFAILMIFRLQSLEINVVARLMFSRWIFSLRGFADNRPGSTCKLHFSAR